LSRAQTVGLSATAAFQPTRAERRRRRLDPARLSKPRMPSGWRVSRPPWRGWSAALVLRQGPLRSCSPGLRRRWLWRARAPEGPTPARREARGPRACHPSSLSKASARRRPAMWSDPPRRPVLAKPRGLPTVRMGWPPPLTTQGSRTPPGASFRAGRRRARPHRPPKRPRPGQRPPRRERRRSARSRRRRRLASGGGQRTRNAAQWTTSSKQQPRQSGKIL
jgi:hypothetical protein